MPPSGGSHSFEHWLESAQLRKTIVAQPQSEPGQTSFTSKSLLIRDELLVASQVVPHVEVYLKNHKVKFVRLTSLLAELKFPSGTTKPSTDVEVWRLLPPHPPVIDLVHGMWADFLKGNKRLVTPNHVLIPASWQDQCPFGPPLPSTTPGTNLHGPNGHGGAAITVIDAGYQWDPAWGSNPLDELVKLAENQAQHPKPINPLTPTTGPVAQQEFQGTWVNDRIDRPDYNGDGLLDALAGHANFVVGVIGQYATHPTVTLWNHFGGFYPDPNEYTRELSVCRSLIVSHLKTKNQQLINLGFAFSPLKDAKKQDVLSVAWDLVFEVLGTNPDTLRVIAPAGNQGTSAMRYPGALNTRYPGQFKNVMAVASHDAGKFVPSLDVTGSPWSNYGSWITCSAVGADVTSAFLHVDMATQDDDTSPRPMRDFTTTNTALWTGTCFAAPKITASIAQQHSTVNSLTQAWSNVLSTTGATQANGLGYVVPI
jgi:hypothetical protein